MWFVLGGRVCIFKEGGMWFVLGGRVCIFKEGACDLYWVGMFTSLRRGHVVCIGWACLHL